MDVTPTGLPEVLLIAAVRHRDARGWLEETWEAAAFARLLARHGQPPAAFVQSNRSRSAPHVLRGLHWQSSPAQGKLVQAVRGRVFDVAVDLRPHSPRRGRWTGHWLEATEGARLWIPPGFAHGFLVGDEEAEVAYALTAPYHPDAQCALRWDDPRLAIDWPLPGGLRPILSERDAAAPGWDALPVA